MKRKVFAMLMATSMVMGLTAGISFAEEAAPVEAKVALITMDQMDVHWVRLEAAAEARVAELNEAGSNITLNWLAPETKDNAQQIQKIESAIADGNEYIIIACNDATSCNNALQEALDAGIKIIYVDAPATLEGSATFATDNYQGGVQAGEYMLKVLTDAGLTEGTIGIVDAQAGVDSCQNRYDGFASVFEGTDFTLGERQYSDGDNAKAQEIANTLIANGAVALYGTNDGATNGAAAAVADAAKNDTTVYCVGWDKSDSNIAHVEGGELLAFMAQNPDVMGSDAIDAVVSLANGEDLAGEVVDTGVSTVSAENVADFK
ncbi:MAG: substrate-binding domain-containing protein [Lachnospiraceae bacterium]|nr:substrate-binding domain-containing protein [Lachnospiraceae bacterium]